ncbi:MAG TPA: chromate resistance protein ChrB domain-containing protein [Ramlibacter sp.]
MDTASPFISPAELAPLLGRADAPLLLDVRRRERFAASDTLLAAARWCAPEAVAALVADEPARDVVVYCAYGHEVSQDAAQALRAAGWRARFLRGGIHGGEAGVDPQGDVDAWRAVPLPKVRKRPDLGVTGESTSCWVTRARPKIDRIACPWLILRFIDPRARFFFVPEGEVQAQATRLQATPFDAAGCAITHAWERCSFDALLQAFALQAPGLAALATIVRAADTDRLALAPPAAGLLAISLGLSRLHADDDAAMLAAALPLYDALYAWCREGQGETHRWTTHDFQKAAA